MYKILVLTNKLNFSLANDCQKSVDFFKSRLPFPISFTFQDVNLPISIKPYKQVQGFDSVSGQSALITWNGLDDSVKDTCRKVVSENKYDCVIFAYDIDAFKLKSTEIITSWTNYKPLYSGTQFIQLAVNKYLSSQGNLWKRITHEMMHAFCYKLSALNYDLLDEMDNTKMGTPFYLNDNPESGIGNYAITLKNIAPYFNLLVTNTPMYKYFTESEVKGLKPELVAKLDKARDIAGVPFKITSGLRSPSQNELVGGVQDSSHLTGLAVDLAVKDGVTGGKILLALAQVGFQRFGFYQDGHIHVDIDNIKPSPCYWIK